MKISGYLVFWKSDSRTSNCCLVNVVLSLLCFFPPSVKKLEINMLHRNSQISYMERRSSWWRGASGPVNPWRGCPAPDWTCGRACWPSRRSSGCCTCWSASRSSVWTVWSKPWLSYRLRQTWKYQMLKIVTNVQIRIMEQIWLNDLVWKCFEDLFKKLQHHQMSVKPLKTTPDSSIGKETKNAWSGF